MLARHVLLTGHVQGVAFRYFTEQKATELDVSGWVRNLADGSVEVWLEADAEALAAMLTWLRTGPAHARVDGLDVREREPEHLTGFEVRRSAYR